MKLPQLEIIRNKFSRLGFS